MTSRFIDTLPHDLVVNVRSMGGARGEEWLRSLPELIKRFETRWAVTAGAVFCASGINYVAPASALTGELLVLKLNPPYDNAEFASEAAYLRSRNGHGCVRLVDEDRECRAMLLERAVPGETMDVVFDGREPECVAPAIDVLRSLVKGVGEPPDEAIRLDDWFANLQRAEGTVFPFSYVTKTLDIYERLCQRAVTYLHGDFHPRNIVNAEREPFLVIDPKGIAGSLGYEIAVFLNNFHWWQNERHDIADRLTAAVRQFAAAFGLSEREIREWAFAQMVISAWWTFDEIPDEYDNDVAKADVWGV